MRSLLLAVLTTAFASGPIAADIITDSYSSFYVLGDSLSDDGNVAPPLWRLTTGGSPYDGNWRDGGTFTNGEVWNEPLQRKFRRDGRDADNFAVGASRSSGGNWLIPDLDGQIDALLEDTSKSDRGPNPLVSLWIGGNNILDAIGGSDAIGAAEDAARTVARGMKRLADKAGVSDFLVFNLPNLAMIPKFRLFEKEDRVEARDAGLAYNVKLAQRIGKLEEGGLNIIDVDVFSLFQDVMGDPGIYGFSDVKLPCVFPGEPEADRFDRPERCSPSTAETLLFMDDIHPTALAHSIIGDLAKDGLKTDLRSRTLRSSLALGPATTEPVPSPLPGSAVLLLGALGVGVVLGRRARLGAT